MTILIPHVPDGAALTAGTFARTNAVLVPDDDELAMVREDGSVARYPLGDPSPRAARLADREVRDGTLGVLVGHRGATYEVVVEQAVETAASGTGPDGARRDVVAKVWTVSWQRRREGRLRERLASLRASAPPRPGLGRAAREWLSNLLGRRG